MRLMAKVFVADTYQIGADMFMKDSWNVQDARFDLGLTGGSARTDSGGIPFKAAHVSRTASLVHGQLSSVEHVSQRNCHAGCEVRDFVKAH
jgi:hypothetical protein